MSYPGPFDEKTIVFAFAKPFCDLPLAATLPTTIPVPVAKDAGPGEYERNIIASGSTRSSLGGGGEKMFLVRNSAWDPASDPLRHDYPDSFRIRLDGHRLGAGV